MRGILIDPYAIRVSDIELPDAKRTPPWDCLAAIYAALSHPTNEVNSLEHVRLSGRDFLLVDGHGQVREPQPLRWFKLYDLHPRETLAGKGLIIGGDARGVECSTTLDLTTIEWGVRFFEVRGLQLVQTVQVWGPR